MMIAINLKTKGKYKVLNTDIVNCTNAQESQRMVLYTNYTGTLFVREYDEFHLKFKILNEKTNKAREAQPG